MYKIVGLLPHDGRQSRQVTLPAKVFCAAAARQTSVTAGTLLLPHIRTDRKHAFVVHPCAQEVDATARARQWTIN
ncbi:hypothetical protein ACWEQC_08865 [Streptomyces shenzhenensis]